MRKEQWYSKESSVRVQLDLAEACNAPGAAQSLHACQLSNSRSMLPAVTPMDTVLSCNPPQVGWVTGPARLVGAVAKAHQFVTFCIPGNLQRGVAHGLQHEQRFYRCAVC